MGDEIPHLGACGLRRRLVRLVYPAFGSRSRHKSWSCFIAFLVGRENVIITRNQIGAPSRKHCATSAHSFPCATVTQHNIENPSEQTPVLTHE